ncbi:MAG: ribonuclease P protein component [Acidimicrobiaceae bacterium]|nr:ribonuclease P protein component [Acidimicrobiaceae bacterium]
MLAPVSRRSAFIRLRTTTNKVRSGPVRVAHQASSELPAAAFTVPKSVGSAVVRNRVKRRLRAILHEIYQNTPDLFLGGDYLFMVSSSLDDFGYSKLYATVAGLLNSVKSKGSKNAEDKGR